MVITTRAEVSTHSELPKPAHEPEPAAGISDVRGAIERIDRAIVELIGERLRVATTLVSVKRAANLPVLDSEQEARVIRRAAEWSREAALPEEEVRGLFWRIIAITRSAQGGEP